MFSLYTSVDYGLKNSEVRSTVSPSVYRDLIERAYILENICNTNLWQMLRQRQSVKLGSIFVPASCLISVTVPAKD
ncbi:hypothetical protein J6590_031160 [Homalodisca vitripennis]|nr:hypothetical protein J6590_031160 [Homalodisca vitripennis]